MAKKVRLSNLKLLYLFKLTTFIIWLVAFTSCSFEIFRFVFTLENFIISYSVLAFINLLAESIIVYLFTYVISSRKILINLVYKSSFYLLLIILTSVLTFNLSLYSYVEFFGLILTIILVLNLVKIIWSKLPMFKLKIFQVAS